MEYRPIVIESKVKTFPTGSTMLNLLLSNSIHGGYPMGKMINLIGDSFTGKTFLLWTLFAELNKNERFKNYNLFFDEPELAFAMDAKKLFGKHILRRVIWEELKTGKNFKVKIKNKNRGFENSETIEEFGRQLVSCLTQPVIYGLDSFDSLYSEKEKPEDDAGFIAARRVRVLNERLRKILPSVKRTDSLLFIISQVRTNMNTLTLGSSKTRSGGKALKHWAHQEIWLIQEKALKRSFGKNKKKKNFQRGSYVIAKTTKNRLTGEKNRSVKFPLSLDYGIDDTTSIIEWLLDFDFLKKSKASIKSPFGTMPKKNLVYYIEKKESRVQKLKEMAQEGWDAVLEALVDVKRKRKYE